MGLRHSPDSVAAASPLEAVLDHFPERFDTPETFAAYLHDRDHRVHGVRFFSAKKRFTLGGRLEIFGEIETSCSILWIGRPVAGANDSCHWKVLKMQHPEWINMEGQAASARAEREIRVLQRYAGRPGWISIDAVWYGSHYYHDDLDQPELLYPTLVTPFYPPGLTVDDLCTAPAFQELRRHAPFIAAYGVSVLQALAPLHADGQVHRDAGTHNVFFDGRAFRLFDPGIVTDPDHHLTDKGMALGTAAIMSPEQTRDPRSVDARTDLYAVACTLFRMASQKGEHPFGNSGGDLPAAGRVMIGHANMQPPLEQLDDADPRLIAVIERGLKKPRNHRFQTAEEMVAPLLEIARETDCERLVDPAVLTRPDFMPMELGD